MTPTLEIDAATTATVAKRFSVYAIALLAACVIYWLVVWAATVATIRGQIGQSSANLVGVFAATLTVGGGTILYVRYVCQTIASSKLVIQEDSFTIRALQKLRANEHLFRFHDVKRVIYGQRLSGAERLFDKLNNLGVPKMSQHLTKDMKAGRLFVITSDDKRTDFQFVDKSFSESEILQFLKTLDANGVLVESGK